jgi:probable addiction module antidote protein
MRNFSSLSLDELVRAWTSDGPSEHLAAALVPKLVQEKDERAERDAMEEKEAWEQRDINADACRGFGDAISVVHAELQELELVDSIDSGHLQQFRDRLHEELRFYTGQLHSDPRTAEPESNVVQVIGGDFLDQPHDPTQVEAVVDGALGTLDYEVLADALRELVKERGVGSVAADAEITRQTLHSALSPGAQPRFDTVARVLAALGLRLSVKPIP